MTGRWMENGIIKGFNSCCSSPRRSITGGYFITTIAYYITAYDWGVRSILEIHEYREIGS